MGRDGFSDEYLGRGAKEIEKQHCYYIGDNDVSLRAIDDDRFDCDR